MTYGASKKKKKEIASMSSSADTQQAPIFHFSKALFFSVFVSLSKHNNDKSEGQLKKGKKKKENV